MDKNLQKIFEEASAPSNPFRMLFLKDSLRILPGSFEDLSGILDLIFE